MSFFCGACVSAYLCSIKQYIEDVRKRIKALWAETLLDAESQKKQFPQYFAGPCLPLM